MDVNKVYELIGGNDRKDQYIQSTLDGILRHIEEGDYTIHNGTNIVTTIGRWKLDDSECDHLFKYFLDNGLIASINWEDEYSTISLYPISKFAKYEDGQDFLFKRVWSKREEEK